MRSHKADIDGPPFAVDDEWQPSPKARFFGCLIIIIVVSLPGILFFVSGRYVGLAFYLASAIFWLPPLLKDLGPAIILREERLVDTDGLFERRSLFGLTLWTRRCPWESVTQLELTQGAWLDFAPKRTLRSYLCLQANAQKGDPYFICTVRPDFFLTVAEFVRKMSPPEVMCDSRLDSYLREKELTLSEKYDVIMPGRWGGILLPLLLYSIAAALTICAGLFRGLPWPGVVLINLLFSLACLVHVIDAFQMRHQEFEISASGIARTVNGVFVEKVSWDHIQKVHLVGVTLPSAFGYEFRGLLLHYEDRKIYLITQDYATESEIIQFVNAVCPEHCERNRSFLEHIEHCEAIRSGLKQPGRSVGISQEDGESKSLLQ